MEWLRLVLSLNLWVSFAKEPYKRGYILQKRRIILYVCIYSVYMYMYRMYVCIIHLNIAFIYICI